VFAPICPSGDVNRHRRNYLKLASSNSIKKDAAQGTAAVALLPTKDPDLPTSISAFADEL